MSNNAQIEPQVLATTAFGELSTADPMPLIQITAQYGILDDSLAISLGGTTSTVDSKFVVSTGTGASNVSAIVSSREAQYKAGQGLACRITALFTEGVANNTQQAGFITSESAFCFGYNGTEYGILHARDGELENQELTITTGATSSNDATVTVDGNSYTVPLTSGTVQNTAYEIAVSLNDQVPGYNFTSNSGVVYALAQLPDFGAGAFSFAAGASGAVGAWVEIKAGLLPIETWINKSDWNVNKDIDIDPTKGNVYQIQIQYLGFGGIKFFIENPETAAYELVHIIRYANTATVPSVDNPIFRVGWATRNSGNTTDITCQGASAAAFNEGKVVYDGVPKTICTTASNITIARTNILALRNRLTFNSTTNRAEIIPIQVSLATDSSKTAVFEVLRNPEVGTGDFLDWSYFDETLSLMEQAANNVTVTGGMPIACFLVKAGSSPIIDMGAILQSHPPGAQFSITARVSSGSPSDMDVSATWKEDL